jgi:tetrahydromethanopterin S-methyltransferase subunit B
MGKFNLSEAANAILGEDSRAMFDSNIKAKQGMRGQDMHQHGQVGQDRVKASVAYGEKDAGVIGHSPEKEDDTLPDYLKGTPSATPPGATPPVGSEKDGVGYSSPKGQPQETMGRADLRKTYQDEPTSYEAIRDRIAGKKPKQTMQMNPGATMQGYGEEAEYDEDSEVFAEEKHDDEAQDKKMIKKELAREKMKEKMREDMDALLGGENLSEEFVSKATTIFEAAVIARAEEVIVAAEEELEEQFVEAVEQVKEDLASKLDDYLNYMVEEWINDNEVAITAGLKAQVVEDFMSGLHNLFKEHYINIPEDQTDVVEELVTRVEELEDELNEQINTSVELTKALNEQLKIEAIHAACEGLTTQTQVEKLKSLAESVEFTNLEEFTEKLDTIKESYFKSPVNSSGSHALNEEVFIEDEKKVSKSNDPDIDLFAKAISKSVNK